MDYSYTVPAASIAVMLLCMAVGIALPVTLLVVLRKKYRCDIAPFFVGCGVMLVFALILEQLVHYVVLNSQLGAAISANIWLYGLYGGAMAGLFEECGRYIAFRTVLRGRLANDANALMYGAGHGGFEVFVILTVGMINNLVYSLLLNTGNAEMLTSGLSGASLAAVQTAFAQLSGTSPALFLVSIIERLAALAAQLALSVLVWFAAKKGGRALLLWPLAFALHLVLDAGAAILNHYVGNVMLVELCVWLFAALCVFIALRVWKRCTGCCLFAPKTDSAAL